MTSEPGGPGPEKDVLNVFTCPQCGASNEYDPWTEQACCRQCGFSPPKGQEMLAYLREQEQSAGEQHPQPDGAPARERTRLTRFLPADGRSLLTGLAWGAFVFAALMLLGSSLHLPGDAVRCLGLLLPFLTTFAVWRWLAWSQTGQ
jgi:hypothetical protein